MMTVSGSASSLIKLALTRLIQKFFGRLDFNHD
jgi:hypothetical protein